MKIKFTNPNVIRLLALGLITAATLTACSSTGSRTRGQKWSDREIAKDVKSRLGEDPTFKYDDVQAVVYDGSVQLTGFVETPEQRLRAAEVASHTRGAKQVINEIMIKATPTGPVTIRDPLGRETGHMLVDTNSTPPRLRNLPANTPTQQGNTTTPESTENPKQ
jgi:hyperosmotically inducible periplasmic protein